MKIRENIISAVRRACHGLLAFSLCATTAGAADIAEKAAGSPGFAFWTDTGVAGNPCMSGQRDFMVQGIKTDGSFEIIISRVSSRPEEEWRRRITTGNENYCWDIVTDHGGNLIVGGYEVMPDGSYGGLLLTKVDPRGNQLWAKRTGDSGEASVQAIAVDSSDNIIAAGYEMVKTESGGTERKIFMSKLDISGKPVWKKYLGDPINTGTAHAIAVDADDNIYIAGGANGDLDREKNAGGEDAFVSKYSKDRKLLWTRLIGTPSPDRATGLVVGSDGAVYVGGITFGNLDANKSFGNEDAFLSKLNSAGQKLWSRQFGSPDHDYLQSVSLSPDGRVVAGVVSHVRPEGVWTAGQDRLLSFSFLPGGQREKVTRTGPPGDIVEGRLAMDLGGNIYMLGPDAAAFRPTAAAPEKNIVVWKMDSATLLAMLQQRKAIGFTGMAIEPEHMEEPFLTRDIADIGPVNNAAGKASLTFGPALALVMLISVF